jgi:hypothetical protein
MKEYRLAAWPDLGAAYHRTAFRRMLSDMSHRHVTVARLVATSGLARHEVRQFVQMLDARGWISQRDCAAPDSMFDSLRPLGGWIRRAWATAYDGR